MTAHEIFLKVQAAQEREAVVLALRQETGTTIAHARRLVQERTA